MLLYPMGSTQNHSGLKGVPKERASRKGLKRELKRELKTELRRELKREGLNKTFRGHSFRESEPCPVGACLYPPILFARVCAQGLEICVYSPLSWEHCTQIAHKFGEIQKQKWNRFLVWRELNFYSSSLYACQPQLKQDEVLIGSNCIDSYFNALTALWVLP